MRVYLINCAKNNFGDLLMAASVVDFFLEKGIRDFRLNGRVLDPFDDRQFETGLENPRLPRFSRTKIRVRKALGQEAAAKLMQVDGLRRGDLVVDVNGFRHGGVHASGLIREDLVLLRYCKRKEAKVIHMPKSYGPFKAEDRGVVKEMMQYVDLAFPRDRYAYAYISEIVGPNDPKVVMAPDHSSYSKRYQAYQTDALNGEILIVPNNKLVEVGMFASEGAYAAFLVRIYNLFKANGHRVTVLFHTQLDYDLYAKRLEEKAVPIFYSKNPFEVKGTIGRSEFVVTSRYHAMINAISQEVPCAVIGWSEKYSGFVEHYNLSELAIVGDPGNYESRVLRIFREKESVKRKIREGRANIVLLHDVMWTTTWNIM